MEEPNFVLLSLASKEAVFKNLLRFVNNDELKPRSQELERLRDDLSLLR